MASFIHLIDQRRLIGPGGSTVSGSIYFYYTGTSVLAPVYQDASLTIPSPNPVEVGAGEIVPSLFLDDEIVYRRVIVYSDGTFDEQDPLGSLFTEGELGLPVGAVVDYSGPTAPEGFLFCFGQAISRTEFSDLFAALGTTYGAGNGTTTFNIPDYRGRIGAGKDNMGGVAANRLTTSITGSQLGATGGDQNHILSESELPSHSHGVTDPGHTHTYSQPQLTGAALVNGSGYAIVNGTTVSNTTGISIQDTGSDAGHNNVQPTIITNKIIKAVPVTVLSLLGITPDFTGKANAAALGISPTALNMGTSSGSILSNNGTAKQWFEEGEAAIESRVTSDLGNLIGGITGITLDYQGSGIPAITATPMTFTADTAATSTDVANYTFLRQANYSGGSSGFTNNALRAYTSVASGVTDFEWTFLSVMDNSATAGENTAIYGQGKKKSTGATWASTFEAIDETSVANPSTGLVGAEVDIRANGTDNNNSRVGVDVVITRQLSGGSPSGAAMQAGWGFRVQTSGDASATVKTGYGFYSGSKTITAFDCSSAEVSGDSFKMGADVPMAFDASSQHRLRYQSTVGLTYAAGGTDVCSLRSDGSFWGKPVTVAALPAAGLAGRRAFVTNANATTFASIVVGGGSNGVPVYDDGTNWRIG